MKFSFLLKVSGKTKIIVCWSPVAGGRHLCWPSGPPIIEVLRLLVFNHCWNFCF